MADDFQTAGAPSAEDRIGYCQDCGKPLTAATVRHVGSGVFCEPCLVRRVGAPAAGGTYTSGFGTTPPATGAYTPPNAPPAHLPNPTLAGFLGLIPGVGAMYNGQFAKGIAHLVIFFILSSLSDHVNGAFGILVAGWIFYQAFEAYHTAKARLMGAPLPNPLGLNDIGDRMGFGKSWTGWSPNTPPGHAAPPNPPKSAAWGASATATSAEPSATAWATTPVEPAPAPVPPVPPANWAGYVPPQAFAQPPAPQPVPWAAAHDATPYNAPYTSTYTAGAATPIDPATGLPTAPVPQRRFPVAAIVLIALGLVALLGTTLRMDFNGSWTTAFVLATLAIAGLARRVSQLRHDHPEGVPPAGLAACVLRWPFVMLVVLAVLFALQAADLYTLGQTWAVIVIAFGASLLAQRSLERAATPPVYPVAGHTVPPAPPATVQPHDDGGRP